MSKLTPYEFDAPAYWASALINGDCSSFSDEDQADFDAFVRANPDHASEVVSCENESWFGHFHFESHGTLGCDMLTYSALSREDI